MESSGQFSHPRRKYPRRRYQRVVGILYQGEFWLARGEEIGEGGLLVKSPRPLTRMDELIVTFFVPGGDVLAIVRSQSRYTTETEGKKEYQLGIQFLNFSFKDKKKIRDYISAKSESEVSLEPYSEQS